MAVKMKDYTHQLVSPSLSVTNPVAATIPQDSYEFMSSGLLKPVRLSEPYLHSPAGDPESFYYTM